MDRSANKVAETFAEARKRLKLRLAGRTELGRQSVGVVAAESSSPRAPTATLGFFARGDGRHAAGEPAAKTFRPEPPKFLSVQTAVEPQGVERDALEPLQFVRLEQGRLGVRLTKAAIQPLAVFVVLPFASEPKMVASIPAGTAADTEVECDDVTADEVLVPKSTTVWRRVAAYCRAV